MKFKKLTIKDIKCDNTVEIITNDDVIKIEAYHESDCCECVYADFDILKYYENKLIGFTFQEVFIKPIKGIGFLLCFKTEGEYGYFTTEKVLIPCYNEQNGYYSTHLELKIKYKGEEEKTDITECSEDHID